MMEEVGKEDEAAGRTRDGLARKSCSGVTLVFMFNVLVYVEFVA